PTKRWAGVANSGPAELGLPQQQRFHRGHLRNGALLHDLLGRGSHDLELVLHDRRRSVFVCGPSALLRSLYHKLRTRPEGAWVHRELWTERRMLSRNEELGMGAISKRPNTERGREGQARQLDGSERH